MNAPQITDRRIVGLCARMVATGKSHAESPERIGIKRRGNAPFWRHFHTMQGPAPCCFVLAAQRAQLSTKAKITCSRVTAYTALNESEPSSSAVYGAWFLTASAAASRPESVKYFIPNCEILPCITACLADPCS